MTEKKDIVYCGICLLPPEYCSYGGASKLEKCKEWLKANNAALYAKIHATNDSKQDKQEQGNGKEQKPAILDSAMANLALSPPPEDANPNADDQQQKQKMQDEKRAEKEKRKTDNTKIKISMEKRRGKKSVVIISNLEKFNVDLRKFAKKCASKFACGASVTTNASGFDEVVIQGDVFEDVSDFILEQESGIMLHHIQLITK